MLTLKCLLCGLDQTEIMRKDYAGYRAAKWRSGRGEETVSTIEVQRVQAAIWNRSPAIAFKAHAMRAHNLSFSDINSSVCTSRTRDEANFAGPDGLEWLQVLGMAEYERKRDMEKTDEDERGDDQAG